MVGGGYRNIKVGNVLGRQQRTSPLCFVLGVVFFFSLPLLSASFYCFDPLTKQAEFVCGCLFLLTGWRGNKAGKMGGGIEFLFWVFEL